MALSRSRCLKAFNSLTISSDSSARPALRLPGLLHYREGFIPLTVAPTPGQPARRMLPWNTCGHTQGLVRIAPPSSAECNFMSQLTLPVSEPAKQGHTITFRIRRRFRCSGMVRPGAHGSPSDARGIHDDSTLTENGDATELIGQFVSGGSSGGVLKAALRRLAPGAQCSNATQLP
jgi:hypothetical protein